MTPTAHSSPEAPTRSGVGQRAATGARRSGAANDSQRAHDDEHASPPRSASASKTASEAQPSTSTELAHGSGSEAHEATNADATSDMPLPTGRAAPPSLQRMPSQTSTDGGSSGAGSAHAANKPHHHAVHSRAHHQIHLSHHGPHHGRGPTTMRGGAGRHRSAIGLMRPPQAAAHRQGGRIGGHGRVGSSSKMVRTSTDEGIRPVIQEEIDDQQDADEEVEEEASSVAAPPDAPQPKEEETAKKEPQDPAPAAGPSAGALKKKRVPVTFVMGSMEDDSDEDEEESVQDRKAAQGQASKENRETSSSQTISKISSTDEADNSDEWASDTTTDSEDERQKAEQERKRAERERIDSMFKKIPIRSQSAADVRLLDADAQNGDSNGAGQQQQVPIRSLLSTIFHPEQQHHMPQQRQGNIAEGVLRGRPHASVADLSRLQPAQSSMSTLAKLRRPSPDVSGGSTGTFLPRPPSVGNLGTLGSFGGLKMSKSAVALPVLSTTGSHSSTNIARGGEEAASSSRARSVHGGADDSEEEYEEEDAVSGSYGGALDRLNELSRLQMGSKQKSNRPLSLRSFGSEHGHERRRMSGGSNASASVGTSGTSRVKRASNSSLDIQARPDLEEEEIRQQRRTSMPFEAASMAAPVHLPHRSRSAVDVPDVGLPQSPRTTRRNMLRDELSESLRQNLLWERQSRNRMLGIGNLAASNAAPANGGAAATGANGSAGDHGERAGSEHAHRSSSQHPHQHVVHQQHHNHHHPHQHPQPHHHHHHHRPQSVLGGNALRPLTAHNSSSNGNTSRESKRYTGDFHQTGW